MEKMLTFSNDEKSLIWSRCVQPEYGTEDEANHFISYCEELGLNPLLDDVVFQKWGNKTKFITKRDALLRLATNQPGYVGPPIAAVVKKGDEFEIFPSEGTVRHKFGSERGEILGAYAVLKHKKYDPYAIFVDFPEYFQANSGKLTSKSGKKNVWDTLPSIMITKVAEVFVLKKQFPLGGIQTQEEMSLEDMNVNVTELSSNTPADNPVSENNNGGQTEKNKSSKEYMQQATVSNANEAIGGDNAQKMKVILKAFSIKDGPSGNQYGLCDVVEAKSNKAISMMVKGNEEIRALEKISPETELFVSIYKENSFTFLDYIEQTIKEDTVDGQTLAVNNDNTEEKKNLVKDNNQKNYQVLQGIVQQKQAGQKGQNKFVKMSFKTNDGKTLPLLAHGDTNVEKAATLPENEQVSIKVTQENGFQFFLGLDQEQKAG
ncbi:MULTISPECIES: recombinase RecT [Oceanobacillus]|uniref:recombinase RecT n=1 Tax=Oceanobacillus TaxID=182709 RepID=UPI0005961263|nr:MULTISPECIES: recombinase RecT [Oceanobacillus]